MRPFSRAADDCGLTKRPLRSIDLPLPLNGSIDSTTPSWTTNILDEYIETIDTFSKYDNVLAYNIGNEVIQLTNQTGAAPFLKAAARDIKAYLYVQFYFISPSANAIASLRTSQNLKTLVGYASVDLGDSRALLAEYLFCDIGSPTLDIFGLNN